jgi:hypothetical protein
MLKLCTESGGCSRDSSVYSEVSLSRRTIKYVMSPMGFGTKNHCTGEDQQQFSRQTGIAQSVWLPATGWTVGIPFPAREKDHLFCTTFRPDLGPTSFVTSRYGRLFLWMWNDWSVNAATHIYLVPRSRMMELYLHSFYFFMGWCLIN